MLMRYDNRSQKLVMRHLSECLMSAERGFFSSSLEFELESCIGGF